jgi:ubiquitin-protein ligase
MLRRINKELTQAPREGNIRYINSSTDQQTWEIICGAGDTIAFDGITISLCISIPSGYPFKAPHIKILHPNIFHPNVLGQELCITISKEWTPKNNIIDMVSAVRHIIMYPNTDNALCSIANELFTTDHQKYILIAVEKQKMIN